MSSCLSLGKSSGPPSQKKAGRTRATRGSDLTYLKVVGWTERCAPATKATIKQKKMHRNYIATSAWGKLLFRPLVCKLRDAAAGIKINIGQQDVARASVIEGHIPHSIHRIRPLRCSHEMKVYTLHEWSQKFQIFFHMGGVPGKIIRR